MRAASDHLTETGIALHVVSCEPGGNDALADRLQRRGVPALPFPVHSDPEQQLLCAPRDDIFVTDFVDAPRKFGNESEYSSYTMVQPAMVVADASLAVKRWWSWRRLAGVDLAKGPLQVVQVGETRAKLVSLRPSVANLDEVLGSEAEIGLFDVTVDSDLPGTFRV